MGVADIYNVPSSPESRSQWAFAHMAHHRDCIRRVAELGGENLTEYPLDPIDFDDPGIFIYNHQQMHNDLNSALGVFGNDLTDVEFSKPAELSAWVQLNASEHYQYNNLLGV